MSKPSGQPYDQFEYRQTPVLKNDLRKALEAIATASFAMQMAGVQSVPELGATRQDVQAIWYAMLHAALAETKSN